jgi:hypothetical protein
MVRNTEVDRMVKTRLGPQGGLDILVSGAFDADAAAQLAQCLRGRPAGRVTIDFSGADALDGAGVAAAARVLAGLEGLVLCGLAWHQLRLLRYCGVEPAPLPARFDD